MRGGQTLQVAAPDGSRTVSVAIPNGLTPGQSFLVTFPNSDVVMAETPDNTSQASESSHGLAQGPGGPLPTPMAAPVPVMPPVVSPLSYRPIRQTGVPFSQALDGHMWDPNPPSSRRLADPPASSNNTHNFHKDRQQRKLLLVQVPKGSVAGHTLYVQVPGENRTLAAKIPPRVSQFHVAYQPKPTAQTTATTGNNHNHNSTVHHSATNNNPAPSFTSNGQKLILVQVPPGAVPGTAMHVEVPDEPGRILAAQVPPNVREFQVAYFPRPSNTHNNNNNNHQQSNRIPQQLQQQPLTPSQGYDVQPYNINNNNNQRPSVDPYGGSGGMGSAMLPLVGGAALATAAGTVMYDQYHNHYDEGYDEGYVEGYGQPQVYDAYDDGYGAAGGYYDDFLDLQGEIGGEDFYAF